jgi:hypothetical protein
MRLSGRCHCGNIQFALRWDPDPVAIVARACTCTFCTRHGAAWTSHPDGALDVTIADPASVSRYAFATGTADLHVCKRCGVVPIVTARIDGRIYAVVNVNTFEGVDPALVTRSPVSLDDEPEDVRSARRRRNWIANVYWP